MKSATLKYILDGALLNTTEQERLDIIQRDIDDPPFETAHLTRAARLKAAQPAIADIISPALERVVGSITDAWEGLAALVQMGLAQPMDLDRESEAAAREILAVLKNIRIGRLTIDPAKIEDGQFLVTPDSEPSST